MIPAPFDVGPVPAWTLVGIAAVPLIFRFGARLAAELLGLDRATPAAALVAGLAAWTLVVHLAASLVKGFHAGWAIGTAVLALAGCIFGRRASPPSDAVGTHRAFPVLATLCFIPVTLLWALHDETNSLIGHFFFINQNLNGTYPPLNPVWSDLRQGYHFGFQAAASILATTFHLRVDLAVSLLTLAMVWASAQFGLEMAALRLGLRWITPAAFVFLMGGGIPWLADPYLGESLDGFGMGISPELAGIYQVGGKELNPSAASNFMQHAWTVGLPTFLLLLDTSLIAIEWSFCRRLTFCTLVVFLGVASTPMAVTGIPCLVAGRLLAAKTQWRKTVGDSLFVVTALIVGVALSGMLSNLGGAAHEESGIVRADTAMGGGGIETLRWHAATFGFTGLLGCVALIHKFPGRASMALLIGGSLLVLNSFEYRYTWDVIKFAATAEVGFAFSALFVLEKVRPKLRSILFSGMLIGSVGFLAAAALGRQDFPFNPAIWRAEAERFPNLSEDELNAIDYMRANIRSGDVVLSEPARALKFAVLGGIPSFFSETNTNRTFAISKERIARRSLSVDYDEAIRTIVEERVRWVVFVPDDRRISRELLDDAVSKGHLVRERKFGSLDLYGVVVSDSPGATTSSNKVAGKPS